MKVLLLLAIVVFMAKRPNASAKVQEEEDRPDFDAVNAEMAAAFIATMTAGRGLPPMDPPTQPGQSPRMYRWPDGRLSPTPVWAPFGFNV